MAAAHMAVGHKAVGHMGRLHTVAGIHSPAGRTCEIQFRVIIRSKETGMVKTNTTDATSLAGSHVWQQVRLHVKRNFNLATGEKEVVASDLAKTSLCG